MKRPVAAVIAVWFALYAWRTWNGHWSLQTNAFDLSVFQYSLWSLAHGGIGFVPFMGHSIFSVHAMPVLAVIAPGYALLPFPMALLDLQLVIVAAAAAMYWSWQRRASVPPPLALGLVIAFLFSRRTHSAVAGSFYPESLQAPLTFLLALTFASPRRWIYWTSVVLLLMTKEDAAIYAGAFALVMAVIAPGLRATAVKTMIVATVWFVTALATIPLVREWEGLSRTNPLFDARFGAGSGDSAPAAAVDRIASMRTATQVVNLFTTAGYLSLVGGVWLAPAVPGILINMAADPESQQAQLMGHYAWPVLPWLFMAAAGGALSLHRRVPRLATAWVAVLVIATLATNPALQRVWRTSRDPNAAVVLAQLRDLTGHTILAQPNLIPHLPHSDRLFAIGGDFKPKDSPDLVLTTTVGNLWPLTAADVQALIARYRADDRYEEIRAGPLFAFRLK